MGSESRLSKVRLSLGQHDNPRNRSYHLVDHLCSGPSSTINQTQVRIRGRGNQLIETQGSVHRTLTEEKEANERKKAIRRSNERLRMLENMEKQRALRLQEELERLESEKNLRDEAARKKRELMKSRRYHNETSPSRYA